jgi:hypothetical protein
VTALVVSQPMFMPWVGMFEQLRLADVVVHYDDVQLPRGRSFVTRVQVKTPQGSHWLTVPVRREEKALIKDVRIDGAQDWRRKHLATLQHAYARAPFFSEMMSLAESVYVLDTDYLCEFNVAGIEVVADYLGLSPRFVSSSSLGTSTHGTQKLVDISQLLGARSYITGLGGRNYLDYALFEAAGIRVEYMRYERAPYPQLHGAFTPSVTILDCIANCGKQCVQYIRSSSVYWRDVVESA